MSFTINSFKILLHAYKSFYIKTDYKMHAKHTIFVFLGHKKLRIERYYEWRHDIQHKDTQRYDIQYNDT